MASTIPYFVKILCCIHYPVVSAQFFLTLVIEGCTVGGVRVLIPASFIDFDILMNVRWWGLCFDICVLLSDIDTLYGVRWAGFVFHTCALLDDIDKL